MMSSRGPQGWPSLWGGSGGCRVRHASKCEKILCVSKGQPSRDFEIWVAGGPAFEIRFGGCPSLRLFEGWGSCSDLRGDVYDRAAAGLAHRGQHGADPQIHAGQVDVDHLSPGRRLSLRDRSETHDACAVDQHGDRAKDVLGGGQRRRPTPLARDVEAVEVRVITKLAGERPTLLLEYVRDHNVRALRDEAAHVAGTHSTGPPVTITVRLLKRFITFPFLGNLA